MRLDWDNGNFENVGCVDPNWLKFHGFFARVLCDGDEAVLDVFVNCDGRIYVADIAFKARLMLLFVELCNLLNNWHNFVVDYLSPNNQNTSFPIQVAHHLLLDFLGHVAHGVDAAEESDRLGRARKV